MYEEVDKLSIELRNIIYYKYNIIIEQNTYRKCRIFSSTRYKLINPLKNLKLL